MRTVCFLGDSITRRGYWIAEIFEHLKADGTVVYNCGVSGDSATAAISRIYTDCLCRTPDTVVVMFGMNDVGRPLYHADATGNEEKKQERFLRYQASIRRLIDIIRESGASPILCTPTPCNDVTPSDEPMNRANDGLMQFAQFIRDLAAEQQIPCVDFFSHLRPMLGKEYDTLPDRVHPTPESHHAMAQFFLKTLGLIACTDPSPFLPMGEEAQARFDVEQQLREIHFIEWNLMYAERIRRKMTHADFLALAAERLQKAEQNGNATEIRWYSNYLRIVENRVAYEDELVRRTLRMAARR